MTEATKLKKLLIDPTIILAPPGEIHVVNRQRTTFAAKPMEELTASIESIGQTTPGLCYVNESGVHQLVFGERRLRACTKLGLDFRYQLTTQPLTPYYLAVLEADENLKREDLTWREEAAVTARLHRLFQEEYGETSPGQRGGHGVKDTAAFLDAAAGKVSQDLSLSEWADAVPEVASAKTRKDAMGIIKRLKEDIVRDDKLEKAREASRRTGVPTVIEPSGEISNEALFQAKLLRFDEIVIEGRLEEQLPLLPPQAVVCFDPPWGVNYDTVALANTAQQTYADDWEYVEVNLPKWLQLIYASMLPDSHLYMFFGIIHHEWVYSQLELAGFTVNRMPLFWHKQGQHRTRNPARWPGRCYEAIAFAHKGNKPLFRQGAPDIISTAPPTAAIKQSHPSAKHPAIYLELLERSCAPGDTVCDPMCGSGMFGVAAEALASKLALDYHMIELSEEHRNLSIFNLAKGYTAITGDTGPSLDDLPDDFRELKPGSPDWKRYWEAFPDEHQDMLAWRLNKD